jgi:hypothetical protein
LALLIQIVGVLIERDEYEHIPEFASELRAAFGYNLLTVASCIRSRFRSHKWHH